MHRPAQPFAVAHSAEQFSGVMNYTLYRLYCQLKRETPAQQFEREVRHRAHRFGRSYRLQLLVEAIDCVYAEFKDAQRAAQPPPDRHPSAPEALPASQTELPAVGMPPALPSVADRIDRLKSRSERPRSFGWPHY